MTIARKNLGRDGESVAASFLEKKGYVILKRNFAFKGGEIDIVAKFEDTVHFIEVKTRKSTDYGTPAMTVNFRKQEKIFKTAEYYLKQNDLIDPPCSFDVIELFKFQDGHYAINMIENAFEG